MSDILVILIIPIHEPEIFFHLFEYSTFGMNFDIILEGKDCHILLIL